MTSDRRNMVQCLLAKQMRYQVAWIREKSAVIGHVVDLIDTSDVRQPGWRVVSAWTRLPEAYLRERSRDYLHTRKASDV
jgi:hypothetical protein